MEKDELGKFFESLQVTALMKGCPISGPQAPGPGTAPSVALQLLESTQAPPPSYFCRDQRLWGIEQLGVEGDHGWGSRGDLGTPGYAAWYSTVQGVGPRAL